MLDSGQLMLLVAQGDTDAFGVLYESRRNRMLNFFYRRLGDRQRAEELFHDLFLTVFRSAGSFDPAKGSLEQWMYSIARNMCKNEYKRRQVAQRAQAFRLRL